MPGAAAILTVLVFILVACGNNGQSVLNPHSQTTQQVSTLWWIMLGISGTILFIIILMVIWGLLRRRNPLEEVGPPREVINGTAVVVFGGIILPIIVLTFVFALSLKTLIDNALPAKAASTVIDVSGRQWWWKISYPQQNFITANEIHVPVGEPVEIDVTSVDVIHTFWVPELQVKIEAIPGLTNKTWLEASSPGTYRGQCAQYCGKQHAHMAFIVVAQPRAAYEQWLATESKPPAPPTTELAKKGASLFPDSPCALCHTVVGTKAHGTFGPDLSHVGSRQYLAAGTLKNTPQNMAQWISFPQKIKPGSTMPSMHQFPTDPFVKAVVAYLQSLK